MKLSYDLMFSMERSEKVFNSTILQILQSKKGLSIFIDIFFTIFNLDRKIFSEWQFTQNELLVKYYWLFFL